MKEFTNDWETFGGMRNLSITSVLYDVMIWYSFEANRALLYTSNGQCMLTGDLKKLTSN